MAEAKPKYPITAAVSRAAPAPHMAQVQVRRRAARELRAASFDHLIGAGEERWRDRRAKNAHSITSLACARIVGETSIPSWRAVWRLITISKFVGC